jgi:hypothetical protein
MNSIEIIVKFTYAYAKILAGKTGKSNNVKRGVGTGLETGVVNGPDEYPWIRIFGGEEDLRLKLHRKTLSSMLSVRFDRTLTDRFKSAWLLIH